MTPTPEQLTTALDLIETWAKEGHYDRLRTVETISDMEVDPDLLLWLVADNRERLERHPTNRMGFCAKCDERPPCAEYESVATFCQQLGALQ